MGRWFSLLEDKNDAHQVYKYDIKKIKNEIYILNIECDSCR